MHAEPSRPWAGKRVLLLDKTLLGKRQGPMRGVELFNARLLRDLDALGVEVTAGVHRTWRDELAAYLCGSTRVRLLPVSVGGKPVANGLATVLRAGGPFEVLLLANVGNGLIPAIGAARLGRRAARCTLIAHREASGRFVRAMRRWPATVVAVNRQIARPFEAAGCAAAVSYGVMDADLYAPGPAPSDGAITRFCVLGQLDNAWKGADTALAAFRLIPPAVQSRMELHLASFTTPPALPEPNVRVYPWMPAGEIPAFLRGMAAMIVPSRDEHVMRETFSQAMVQGMLTGLPILANDLPILTEKLDAGGGVIFRTPAELAAQMVALHEDAARRRALGTQARAVALDRYVWNTAEFVRRFVFPVTKNHVIC